MSEVNSKNPANHSTRPDPAKRPISEKLAIASRLRKVQENLAPIRAANKAKRAAKKIEIRIKTA